ncbi:MULTISPECIES: NUDIX domain-containing protein [Streptomyces]|uniref:NUDIX domain-containing protein n=1 Tax=Streptomyces caniscabiei TaxID=2746961 RepID=A0ABU4N008_9ACTN|nr:MULTISPECIES: NUDIX domain-containing protein [Streptomyces]MBE4736794.1 NUDIX domain-containing protein [Streptomyces caniscabiei]MBE4759808.1 NUDIX domain-containing protein [Streptomyces caniscabiei]MBE4770718.1 NUDIX domain-containing protein [Streptomyces caniscabiei]MBE4786179.1 NUDIX domain-containing protein [Streptomyces caniscabiei]MBE4796310.1 NUDIX domain-containing protein [Streptomyces caniscabiei]
MSANQHPPANSAPDSHCSSCGAPYGEGVSGWPRTCETCRTVAYRNPLPVAVALQPVYDTQGTALVVITRTIAPARGGTALPGGFIDHREDWRHAVVRELKEETGICVADRDVRLADAMSSPAGHLLLFGLLPERPAAGLPAPVPTDETEGWHLLRRPTELAFPLHTLAVQAFFDGRYI